MAMNSQARFHTREDQNANKIIVPESGAYRRGGGAGGVLWISIWRTAARRHDEQSDQ